MKSNDEHLRSYWRGRIIGAVAVAGVSYCLLSFGYTWPLNTLTRFAIAALIGMAFLMYGDNIVKWIYNIDLWS